MSTKLGQPFDGGMAGSGNQGGLAGANTNPWNSPNWGTSGPGRMPFDADPLRGKQVGRLPTPVQPPQGFGPGQGPFAPGNFMNNAFFGNYYNKFMGRGRAE